MTAIHSGAGVEPPTPKKEKGARTGANLHGITETRLLSISAESVKREADHHFMLWLKNGVAHHRTIARVLGDAARKGAV